MVGNLLRRVGDVSPRYAQARYDPDMTDLSLVHTLDAILSRDTHDLDPAETAEWRDALDALTTAHGPSRARFILDALLAHARRNGVNWLPSMTTPYVNSIPLEAQPPFPGDLAMEQRLAALMRWNALAMVMRANQVESGGSAELGGHIASYASAADLFEVGFNHFFRARNDATSGLGDLVFFQPHSAPGVYARAFLEGRLSADDLAHYRQELSAPAHGARGLTSYPHPMLMPDFWQFPTGSMGIGPINAIYQARFIRYLQHRGLLAATAAGAAQRSRVLWATWCSSSRTRRPACMRAPSSKDGSAPTTSRTTARSWWRRRMARAG